MQLQSTTRSIMPSAVSRRLNWLCRLLALLILVAGDLPPVLGGQVEGPLPCVAPPPTDPAPWVMRSRILQSFPPDQPLPLFLGGFSDGDANYRLELWRDSHGIFGELLHPVLDADSPTSRLYDARLDPNEGTLEFTARFGTGMSRFVGRLRGDVVTGTITQGDRSEQLVLRQVPSDEGLRDFYSSRAQFECAMILFRRQ